MSKVTDDVLKKVTGGSFGEDVFNYFWGEVTNLLTPILDTLKVDPTYGTHAGCILQVLKDKSAGSYGGTGVSEACQALKSAPQIQANELAVEYLQAIDDFVNGF